MDFSRRDTIWPGSGEDTLILEALFKTNRLLVLRWGSRMYLPEFAKLTLSEALLTLSVFLLQMFNAILLWAESGASPVLGW